MQQCHLVSAASLALVSSILPIASAQPTPQAQVTFESIASSACDEARLPDGSTWTGLRSLGVDVDCKEVAATKRDDPKAAREELATCQAKLRNLERQLWFVSFTTMQSGHRDFGPTLYVDLYGREAALAPLQGEFWPFYLGAPVTASGWWGFAKPTGYAVALQPGFGRSVYYPVLTTTAPSISLAFTEIAFDERIAEKLDLKAELVVRRVARVTGSMMWRANAEFPFDRFHYEGVQVSLVAWQVSDASSGRVLGVSHPRDMGRGYSPHLCDGTQDVPAAVPASTTAAAAKARWVVETAEAQKAEAESGNADAEELGELTCTDSPTGRTCRRIVRTKCPAGTVANPWHFGCYCRAPGADPSDDETSAPAPSRDHDPYPGGDGRYCVWDCPETP